MRRTPTGLFRFDYRDATILEIVLFPLVYFVIGFVIVGAAYLVSLGHPISWITIVGTTFAACVAILVAGVCGGFAGAAWAIAGYHEFRRRSRHRTDHRLQKRLQQLLAEDSPWVRAHRSIDTECLHANPAPPIRSYKEAISGIPQPLNSRWNYVVWDSSSPYPRLHDCWKKAPQRIRMK